MPLEEESLPGLAELVEYLLDRSADRVIWFRGQGCHSYSLRPSLYRKLSPFDPETLLTTEHRLITRFRQQSLPFWPEGYPQDNWEHLLAMQHYGVPTRLLDWTENALVGCYFAADHDPNNCECGSICTPTIWVLDPVYLNQRNSRLEGMDIGILASSDDAIESWSTMAGSTRLAPWPIAMFGTHNSQRIVAQRGTFTVAGKNDTALERVPAVAEYSGTLAKVTLELSHEDIRNNLRTLGITQAAVFPGLDGIAHDLRLSEIG